MQSVRDLCRRGTVYNKLQQPGCVVHPIQPMLCACVLLLKPMLISFVQPVRGLHDYACMPYCCNFSQVIACVGSSLIL